MRIIGGALRGRRLRAKPGPATRPTSDRVRQAIASALEARCLVAQASVVDLFAGTGALGLEALSRGADRALLVDSDRRAVESMRQNSAELGLGERVQALELDLLGPRDKVESAMQRTGLAPFTLAFMDAPYAQVHDAVAMLDRLASTGLIAVGAAVVVEYALRTAIERPVRFRELAAYRHGDSGVVLWETIACEGQT